jgi:hypothetical protein
MRALEDYSEWPRMEALLADLDDACQNFRIDRLRELLLAAPTGYTPTELEVNDLLWHQLRR